MWLRVSTIRLQSWAAAKQVTVNPVCLAPAPSRSILLSPSARSALLSLQSLSRRRLLYPVDKNANHISLLSDTSKKQSSGNHKGSCHNANRNHNYETRTTTVRKNLVQLQLPKQQLLPQNGYLSAKASNRPSAAAIHSNGVTDTNDESSSSLPRENGTNDGEGYVSDLVVVLDMDECLIHSQFLNGETDDEYRQYEEERSAMMEGDSIVPSNNGCETFRVSLLNDDDDDPENKEYVHVYCRPHLQQFLSLVSSQYETHICTAAMEVYARPVLEYLDSDGTRFGSRIYYRDSCTHDPEWGVYVKDLSRFLPPTFNPARTVLVDNNPFSFLSHPSNGILVSNFYDDPKDDTLQAVYELLQELEHVSDVRPILEKRFHLKETLDQVLTASHHNHDNDRHSTSTTGIGPTW